MPFSSVAPSICQSPVPIPSPPPFPRRRRGAPLMRGHKDAERRRRVCNEHPSKKGADLWFENVSEPGATALDCPLQSSFSINKDSEVKKDGIPYEANDLHFLQVVKVDWAREGEHVLKVFADGSSYPDEPFAWRSELGAVYNCYTFKTGDFYYVTASFWPDESWCQVSKYATIITQFKMASDPHATLKLSNKGDYKLTFKGGQGILWDNGDGEGAPIGYATPRAWNDIKIFAKWSLGDDGFIKVWLNGTQVFEHHGRTLLEAKDRGYVKFGMYTEIYDKRTIYFDAVRFSDYLDVPFEEWLNDQANLPVISLTSPSNETQYSSGSSISVVANAVDPGGRKYGSPGEVAKVEFFAGTCSLGVVATSPYSVAFSPRDGAVSLTAQVTDSDGNMQRSSPILVYVGNRAPDVELLAPAMNDNLPSSEATELQAMAYDHDGTVSRVEFYAGDDLVGIADEDVQGIFSVSWQPPEPGAFLLQAKAIDEEGLSSTSKPTKVTVDAVISTSSLIATDDTTLKEGDPSDTGNWASVEVYGYPGGRKVGLYQFDISSLHGVPEIRKALLALNVEKIKDDDPTDISVFGASGSHWDEDSVTWSSRPEKGDRLSVQLIQSPGLCLFDLSAYISQAVLANEQYVTLWLEEESLDYKRITFDSLKSEQKPKLEVTTSTIPLPADAVVPVHDENCSDLVL
eukprot:gb/GFBE01048743.1/.p1 GENE.gb/GFBE01048743.1/~~gb/GFBE01048743.1/.p1  ORF type:complete len:685 (+),score=103.27 gb/GFBE01048743.1/:1-2055(+)